MPSHASAAAPSSLHLVPDHLHASLQRLAASTYFRGDRPSRGWTSKKGDPVPADHVTQLSLRNLCKVKAGRRRTIDRAELTELGHVFAEMVTRAKAKGSAE